MNFKNKSLRERETFKIPFIFKDIFEDFLNFRL